MAIVRIDGTKITDWASFHIACKEAFGFPSFYGENMDAFIDCLTYIDERDGMSRIVLSGDEMLTIEVTDSIVFETRIPEVFGALSTAVVDINDRFIERGKEPRIRLRRA
jgi:hypothetical protein